MQKRTRTLALGAIIGTLAFGLGPGTLLGLEAARRKLDGENNPFPSSDDDDRHENGPFSRS